MKSIKQLDNVSDVFTNSLCCGCGTCFSVCPNDCIKLTMHPTRGAIEPKIDEETCTQCGLCLDVCPGLNWPKGFSSICDENTCSCLGSCKSSCVGASVNDNVAFDAASGGMLTETLLHLLDSEQIDGAIVTKTDFQDPLMSSSFIARTKDELMMARGSIYFPTHPCSVLRDVMNTPGRFAFVGLPCQLAGVVNMTENNPALAGKITVLIGLFCSRTPSFNATRQMLHGLNMKFNDVKNIFFRGGGKIPGRLKIERKRGDALEIEHLASCYWGYTFFNFFKPVRCWLCHDHAAMLADLAFSDNWTGKTLPEKGCYGTNMVVSRTEKGERILAEMQRKNCVQIIKIDTAEAAVSQALHSKGNVAPRIWWWRRIGMSVPAFYGDRLRHIPATEILKAVPEMCRVFISGLGLSSDNMRLIIGAYRAHFIFIKIIKKCIHKLWNFYQKGVKAILLLQPVRGGLPSHRKKQAKYKVVMIGGYGHKDIGDESMPHAMRMKLREALGNDLDLVMLSDNPSATTEFHGEKSVKDFVDICYSPSEPFRKKVSFFLKLFFILLAVNLEKCGIRIRLWTNARDAIDEIMSADIILNVGGGNINTVIPFELYKKCTTYLIASHFNKEVYLSGQTMGPFLYWFDRKYASLCLNKVKMITFRDKDVSHNRLLDIGVNNPVMFDAADDAITLNGVDKTIAQQMLESETGLAYSALKKKLLFFMNIKASLVLFKSHSGISNLDNEVKLMACLCDSLIDKYNCNLILFPTDFSCGVDDRVYHDMVLAIMKHKDSVYSMHNEYNDEELIGMIGCCDMAIGGRYHFNVFAASQGVPFFGISSGVYQRTKLKGLADLCGLPECYADVEMGDVAFDEVWPIVVNAVEKRDYIHTKLTQKIPSLKEASMRVVASIADYLKNGSTLRN